MKKIYLLKSTLFVSSLLCSEILFGQYKWYTWDKAKMDFRLSKNTTFEVSHLRSYDLNNSFLNQFNQTGIAVGHSYTKTLNSKAGYIYTSFPSGSTVTNRVYLGGTHKIPIGDILNWTNGIQGEMNFANGKTNFYKIRYSTKFTPKNRLEFLRLLPSLNYSLYYLIGGNAIKYYDEDGTFLARETPDGVHRGRFTFDLNSRIAKDFTVSVYLMNQHEFNFIGKDINVVNPNTGKISRPFINYNVVGLSLAYYVRLYRK